jgi:hypothetical protein
MQQMDAVGALATTLEDHIGITTTDTTATNTMYVCSAVVGLLLVLIMTCNTPVALLFLSSAAGQILYP